MLAYSDLKIEILSLFFKKIKFYLEICVGHGSSSAKHAVGSRDDVLGGHQGSSTELTSTRGDQSHHPGVFVFLIEKIRIFNQTMHLKFTGSTSEPPTILLVFSTPHLQPLYKIYI